MFVLPVDILVLLKESTNGNEVNIKNTNGNRIIGFTLTIEKKVKYTNGLLEIQCSHICENSKNVDSLFFCLLFVNQINEKFVER